MIRIYIIAKSTDMFHSSHLGHVAFTRIHKAFFGKSSSDSPKLARQYGAARRPRVTGWRPGEIGVLHSIHWLIKINIYIYTHINHHYPQYYYYPQYRWFFSFVNIYWGSPILIIIVPINH